MYMGKEWIYFHFHFAVNENVASSEYFANKQVPQLHLRLELYEIKISLRIIEYKDLIYSEMVMEIDVFFCLLYCFRTILKLIFLGGLVGNH